MTREEAVRFVTDATMGAVNGQPVRNTEAVQGIIKAAISASVRDRLGAAGPQAEGHLSVTVLPADGRDGFTVKLKAETPLGELLMRRLRQ